jgi:hypothetical protein
MTVAELKKVLDECDDDMEVRCDNLDDNGFYEYVTADCEVRQDLYSGKYFVYIGDENQFI